MSSRLLNEQFVHLNEGKAADEAKFLPATSLEIKDEWIYTFPLLYASMAFKGTNLPQCKTSQITFCV